MFVSEAQRNYMWKNHPAIAEKWEKETPRKHLPKYAKDSKADPVAMLKRGMRGEKS